MCSTDSYLYGRDRHWANLSLEQHLEVTHEAALDGRTVKYLLVTAFAGAPAINYWVLPGKLIERLAFADPGQRPDYVYSLHIREDEQGRFLLEGEDVSEHHHLLTLNPASASRLDRAFDAVRETRERRLGKRGAGAERSKAAQVERGDAGDADYRQAEFEIPLRGGRAAVLQLPLPAAEVDLARIKGWIDLMNDVLTEQLPREGDDLRERAIKAVVGLQVASVESGKNQLADDDIEQEIHKARGGRN
jgi:hypothetical protein